MFDYTALSGSSGSDLSEEKGKLKGIYYTAQEGKDERGLYEELNESLTRLETDTALHEDDLATIEEAADGFVVSIELKEEIQLRIDWIKRLYKAQHSMPSANTIKEAERLRSMIAPVQTCPLKAQLSAELEDIMVSLPAEVKQVENSASDELMERAIEQAGEEFINLGAAGRIYIVEKLLTSQGTDISIELIQQTVEELERQVTELQEVESAEDLKMGLDALPLPSFALLTEERKDIVVSKLQEKGIRYGVASLDRMIHQIDRAMSAAATLEKLDLSHSTLGDTATSLDVSKLDSGTIRFT